MARFLHTADWQIGTQFGSFDSSEATLLAEARLDTVTAIAKAATERKVDAVLVAGDVFDHHTVSSTLIRRLFGALGGFAGRWVLLPGNHDSALAESVWRRAQRLNCIPASVTVVTAPGPIELPDCGVVLLPAPLTQRQTFDDLTAYFDREETPAQRIRVGLAHGSVSGILPEAADSTNPIAPNRAQTARLDYLALGDWHGAFQVNERTWYAGTPEQDRHKGNRPGYVLDVTIDGPGALPRVEEVRLGRYTWQRWDEVVNGPTDVEVLIGRLNELAATDVLRIEIEGTANLESAHALEQALEIVRARVRALRADMSRLLLEPTADEVAALGAGTGYLANVVASLRDLQVTADQGAIATEALHQLARIQRAQRGAQ